MKPGVAARVAAADIVRRVLDEGAFSNVAVDEARRELSVEDGDQVQRVVMGVLRHLTAVDGVIEERTRRAPESLDPEVRAVLRCGIVELLVDAGEPHGVVDSAVEAARKLGAGRATGLVNATLRRIAADRPALGADTFPDWIPQRLAAVLGPDETVDALGALDAPVGRGVRIRPNARIEATRVPGVPDAAYVSAGRRFPPGSVDFIDPASTAVASAAGVVGGMEVLDAAAAPGGKTAALWDAMGGVGTLVAADAHRARLMRARRRLRRMGVAPHFVVADATHPPFGSERFDVVLLDAPCSGLGTVRRRPEIRHRLRPDDPAKLGESQRRMIEALLELVRPGGRLVYAVCTLFAEETTAVVSGFGGRPPEGAPGRDIGGGVLLAPHITGTDGMFISVIEP